MNRVPYHWSPELLKTMIDVIPKLCKSKNDLLLFFNGAGVAKHTLAPYEKLLSDKRKDFNKYHVTREILALLNEEGDRQLATRREILKRVAEFEDYTVCWDNDRAAARGLVAQVKDLVNVKDSFTRMRIEKDEERKKRLEQENIIENKKEVQRSQQLQTVKSDLFSLFKEQNAQKRGKALEKVLNKLFDCYEVSVREDFTIKGNCGEGIIEQIDGLIELDGHLYLVEMKWWNKPIGVGDVAPHLVRVYNRGGQVRGLFISYTDFTSPAIEQCKQALSGGKIVVLATLKEIVNLIENEDDLKQWLKMKVHAAIIDKQPYHIE